MKNLIVANNNSIATQNCDCGQSIQSWLVNHAQILLSLNGMNDETIADETIGLIRCRILKNKILDFVSKFSPIPCIVS